jgi:hypothetical protein
VDDYKDEEYRDDWMDGNGDAELDQVVAAIRDGAPMLSMMFFEFARCGLCRADAAAMAVAWFKAS